MALEYGGCDDTGLIQETNVSLAQLLCTSVLLGEMKESEANLKLRALTKDNGLARLENARSSAMWMVCAVLDDKRYGSCESSKNASERLKQALGDVNCKAVVDYIQRVCSDIKDGRNIDQNRQALITLVDDTSLRRVLKLVHE